MIEIREKVKVTVFPWGGGCKVTPSEGMVEQAITSNNEELSCACGGSCEMPGFGPRLFCAPFKGEFFDEYDPEEEFFPLIEEMKVKFPGSVEVEIAEYTSPEKLYRTIDLLNQVLCTSVEDFLVTPENVLIFVSHATPIIVINDKIEFAGEIPNRDKLFKRINEAVQHLREEREGE